MIILALILGLLGSCKGVDDGSEDVVEEGDMACITMSFRVNPEILGSAPERSTGGGGVSGGDLVQSYSVDNAGVSTDEGTAPGYVPRDIWVIQFNGVTDDAVLVGRPRYVEISGAVDIQAVATSWQNTLFFVANTHDATLEFGDIGTLGKFKRASREIKEEQDCYGSNYSSHNDLILSGKYEGLIAAGAISVELFRNIARLDFTLRNGAGSSMTLQSIQLCNVPKDLYYAAGTIATDILFPTMLNYFDYPSEALSTSAAPGGVESFTFYMPVNQRGVVASSTSGKTKSENAPSFSTYIKIEAMAPGGQAYTYRIYPGANIVNDYNISANNRYTLELALNAPGDASSDGRIENYADIDFPAANSFILNLPPSGAKPRIFTIPIDQINEFWKGRDASLTLGPADAWTVELIWQDTPTPNCIGFVDMNNPSASPTNTFQGTGPTQRIALTALSGSEGNALIGIKKVGREAVGYLWSWHLWMTDYDPTYTAAPDPNQFVYSVPGGAVHRYQGELWSVPNARYSDKYIMDRNLGARRPERTFVGALYYQFGRKDPMPMIGYGNVLYDINGIPLAPSDPRNATAHNINGGTGVTLATGVLNPTFYYYTNDASINEDWTFEGRRGNHLWNHPVEGIEQKSLFDPCPPGWELPIDKVWSDFICIPTDPFFSTVLNISRDPKLSWDYYGGNGLSYWPRGHTVNGCIHYPAFGHRYATGGFLTSIDLIAYYWTSSVLSLGIAMDARQESIGVNIWSYRSHGFPVRCVQE